LRKKLIALSETKNPEYSLHRVFNFKFEIPNFSLQRFRTFLLLLGAVLKTAANLIIKSK
jgi:hypothetical protein